MRSNMMLFAVLLVAGSFPSPVQARWATLVEKVVPYPGLEVAEKELPLVVPRAQTDRTYLYFGFPPGAMVMDGGERVSVDLPRFVDALAKPAPR